MTSRHSSTTVRIQVEGSTFEVAGNFYPSTPGRYSGPPEDCFPDEPGEFEVDSVKFIHDDDSEPTLIPYQLLEKLYVRRHPKGTIYEPLLDVIANAALEAAEKEASEFEPEPRERAEPAPWED